MFGLLCTRRLVFQGRREAGGGVSCFAFAPGQPFEAKAGQHGILQLGGSARKPGSYVVLPDDGDVAVGNPVRGGFASGRIRPGHPLRHFFTEDRPGNSAAVQRMLNHNPARICVRHRGPLAATDVRRRLDAIT